jgi:hypothetical protein
MTLADDLKTLHLEYATAPFWFWNDKIESDEVRRQIVTMFEQNIGGFFMHARMGRVTPYMGKEWMAAVEAGVDQARQLGMGAWIYDEDGWPSGYGGGAVNALGDEYLQQYALAEEIAVENGRALIKNADKAIAVFAGHKSDDTITDTIRLPLTEPHASTVELSDVPGNFVVVFRHELHNYRRFFSPESWTDGYVDVLNPKVVRAFIRKIYEPYRKRIGQHFGTVVPGVFTDEPSYHDWGWRDPVVRLPMSPVLDREFEKRYGAPLNDALMAIGYGGPDQLRARWCYYCSLAHLFANSYTKTLARWCGKHGIAFTGHYLLEEYPRASTQVVGDVMQHYYHQQYPGIDHLGKGLDLPDFWSSTRVLVKQAASVAHQFDKPRLMCETFAGGGWDFGPAEQKWQGDWQYAMGLNLNCQHAFHYSLRGFRKRDYPPSLGFQQPWFEVSGDLGLHFARLGYLLTRGRRVVNVLLLHPIESFFATQDAAGFPWPDDPLSDSLKAVVSHLLSNQIDFDFGNEVLMKKHGKVHGASITIGSGRYDAVIVPPSVTWRKSTLSLLRKFIAAGGPVFSVEPKPTHVEGVESDACDKLLRKATNLGDCDDAGFERRLVDSVAPAARAACTLEGEKTCDVLVMHRETDDEDIFFLTSATTTPHTCDATFQCEGVPQLLDTTTGELAPMAHQRTEAGYRVQIDFDYARSFPIVFARDAAPETSDETRIAEKTLCRLGDSIPYRLENDNALILDKAEVAIDDESLGSMWVIDAQKRLEQGKREASARLRFTVSSDTAVPAAALLVESPEHLEICVNGRDISTAPKSHWFIDPALQKIDIPDGLCVDDNIIEIRCAWQPGMELEPVYLLGHFGVDVENNTCRLTPLPGQLDVGSWHTQGLAFYAGSVTYTFDMTIEQEADRWELHCPGYQTAMRVLANGADAGTLMWAPHRIDLTGHIRPGDNRIDLQVHNCLRNFFGPHHLASEDDIPCLGPHHFFIKEDRTDEYRLKPAGLLGPVTLYGYRRQS